MYWYLTFIVAWIYGIKLVPTNNKKGAHFQNTIKWGKCIIIFSTPSSQMRGNNLDTDCPRNRVSSRLFHVRSVCGNLEVFRQLKGKLWQIRGFWPLHVRSVWQFIVIQVMCCDQAETGGFQLEVQTILNGNSHCEFRRCEGYFSNYYLPRSSEITVAKDREFYITHNW